MTSSSPLSHFNQQFFHCIDHVNMNEEEYEANLLMNSTIESSITENLIEIFEEDFCFSSRSSPNTNLVQVSSFSDLMEGLPYSSCSSSPLVYSPAFSRTSSKRFSNTSPSPLKVNTSSVRRKLWKDSESSSPCPLSLNSPTQNAMSLESIPEITTENNTEGESQQKSHHWIRRQPAKIEKQPLKMRRTQSDVLSVESFINGSRKVQFSHSKLFGSRSTEFVFNANEENNPISRDFFVAAQPKIPYHTAATDAINRITPETLKALLDNDKQFDDLFSALIVIDCRFPYEFDGGHIKGAININSMQTADDFFFGENALYKNHEAGKVCLIFHCEFSSHRAPRMALHVRNKDRSTNMYPNLFYPEIYILEGGYRAFYNALTVNQNEESRNNITEVSVTQYCQPPSYVEMNDPEYKPILQYCKKMDKSTWRDFTHPQYSTRRPKALHFI